MSTSPAFAVTVQNKSVALTVAETTVAQALNTALGGTGGFLKAMYIANDGPDGVFVDIFRSIGGTDYLLQTVWVPALAGTDNTSAHVAALDVLAIGIFGSSLDPNNQHRLDMDATIAYKVAMHTTLGAGITVTVNADFKLY